MTELDVAGGFDVHEHRSQFKLLRQDANTMYLENHGEFECPACGGRFDRLFVTENEEVTFSSRPSGPVCVARAPDQLLVFTH